MDSTPAQIPAKATDVFEYLKQCADDMRTVEYAEIARETGLATLGIGRPLGYIRDEICIPRGLPWLNMIAVNKASGRPGDSFLPDEIDLGASKELLWRGMVLQVFSYDWGQVPFND